MKRRRVNDEYMASWFRYRPGEPPRAEGLRQSPLALPRRTGLMKLAILGTRGIPAGYGGFETFAEELSRRLAERGHAVTVYCRQPPSSSPSYRGVRLLYLPTIRHKYLDTVAHTFLSTLHLLVHRQDVALYCNAANAIFTAGCRASSAFRWR